MMELQKLSLKKLRKRGTPLYVLDHRSKRKGGFVIVDLESYSQESMEKKEGGSRRLKAVLHRDWREMGLLWDREMTNHQFSRSLHDRDDPDHFWAVGRLIERLPSSVVTQMLSLDEIREALPKISLWPREIKEAWQNAVRYWSQNP